MPNKNELRQLAEDAGWGVEDRGDSLRFQPKDERIVAIDKSVENAPNVSRRVAVVKLGRMKVDHRFQRDKEDRWVDSLNRDWDPDAVGLLVLSERPDGSFVVLDGQQRREVMLKRGIAEAECLIYSGLTFPMESSLFNKLNERLRVHPIIRFHARLLAGEPTEVAIEHVLNQYGTRTAWKVEDGYPCVTALEKIHSLGVLRDTIEILEASWPQESIHRSPVVVRAMAQFCQEHLDGTAVAKKTMNRAIAKFEAVALKPLVLAAKSQGAGTGKPHYYWLARSFQRTHGGRRS